MRRQPQFESDRDRDRIVWRHVLRAVRDIALIILMGMISVAGMIWIAMEGQKNNW